ncbi:cupin domain-containing protein [Chloroflexota bacterium]
MKIVNIDQEAKRPVELPLFTGGSITIQPVITRSMGKDFNAFVVNFGKGARSKFHSHNCDQILIVTVGKGIVTTGEEERFVGPGDIILIPSGEKHWHGAIKDTEFSHIAIEVKGSELTQLED